MPAIESTSRIAVWSACTTGCHRPVARASSNARAAGAVSSEAAKGRSIVSASSTAQLGARAPTSGRYACQP